MSIENNEEIKPAISPAQMRYLYKIYQISLSKPEVLSADVARKLKVSKPSVVKTLAILSEKKLIFKKRYGKISITEQGVRIAHEYESRIQKLAEMISKMDISLTEEEIIAGAFALADVFSDEAWDSKKI